MRWRDREVQRRIRESRGVGAGREVHAIPPPVDSEDKFGWPRRFQMTGYCHPCRDVRMIKRPDIGWGFLLVLTIVIAVAMYPLASGGTVSPGLLFLLGLWRSRLAVCVVCHWEPITYRKGRDSESLMWQIILVSAFVWMVLV